MTKLRLAMRRSQAEGLWEGWPKPGLCAADVLPKGHQVSERGAWKPGGPPRDPHPAVRAGKAGARQPRCR